MTRSDALRSVIAALQTEIAAMKAFDINALVAATAEKEKWLDGIAAANDEPLSDEIRALAAEAQALNETARVYVNLLTASVQRRLEALTGAVANAYGPTGRTIAA